MDFYPPTSSIDLREELNAILYGRSDMVPQGRSVVVRRLTDEYCECYDRLNGGPRKDCSFCQGEGFKFTETEEIMFLSAGKAPMYQGGFLGTGAFPLTAVGFDDPSKATAFCEYSVFPDYERYLIRNDKGHDKLFELKISDEGTTQYPQIRTAKWKIINVTPIHGDFGRVEYFVLALDKEYIG
jgi:hypothetical protein